MTPATLPSSCTLTNDLDRFHRSHHLEYRQLASVRWEYIACGQGTTALLLLPGGPGRAETSWQYILGLEGNYRIIAPSYPSQIVTARGLLEGLVALLRAEGIQQVHIVGGSYSGLVAQCFVRRYPERVASLILTDTGIPRVGRGRRHMLLTRCCARLPMVALRSALRLGVVLFLMEAGKERPFWRAYFERLLTSLTRQDCISRLLVWIDIDTNYRFKTADLRAWKGAVMVVEATADAVFAPAERASLRLLYPDAETFSILDSGHAASLLRSDDYISLIADFVARHALPARGDSV